MTFLLHQVAFILVEIILVILDHLIMFILQLLILFLMGPQLLLKHSCLNVILLSQVFKLVTLAGLKFFELLSVVG